MREVAASSLAAQLCPAGNAVTAPHRRQSNLASTDDELAPTEDFRRSLSSAMLDLFIPPHCRKGRHSMAGPPSLTHHDQYSLGLPSHPGPTPHRPSAGPALSKPHPYTLSAVANAVHGHPATFWLSGTGDMRALAGRTGLIYDHAAEGYRCPTPYHARLLWCYADSLADRELKRLFPRFSRPARPRYVPFMMATSDRVICLTSPESDDLPRNAGFVRNDTYALWQTNDLRRAVALQNIAEEDLQRRLQAISALPFDSLADISVSDLVRLPPPPAGEAGDSSEAANDADDGSAPVLEFDPQTNLYSCRHPAAKGAGFRPRSGTHVSNDFEQAQQLRAYATDEAELRLQADAAIRCIPDPYAVDPRPIPESPAAPFPFGPDQIDGIRFATTRYGTLIADDMGTGKTAQALGVINVEAPRLVLVLAPAKLLRNWLAECGKWLAPPNTAAIFGTAPRRKKGMPPDRSQLPAGANVLIVSYQMLPKLTVLHDMSFDILICDEAQEIKSELTKAGDKVYNHIAPRAGKLIWMTGTPVWNRPQDLWAPLHALAPDVFPHKDNFLRLYKVSDPEKITPAQRQRLDFLAHLLKSGLMIRRLKEDVLDLPPKEHEMIDVPLDPDVLQRIRERNARVEAAEREAAAATGKAANAKNRTLFSEVARLRMEAGEAKYDFVLKLVCDFLKAEHVPAGAMRSRPAVIFGRHRHLLRRMQADLIAAGYAVDLATGDVTAGSRQKRVDNFQDGKSDVIIGSLDGAGVGYTMIRACDFFVFELDFTPALMKQSIDRIHRRGQTRVCRIRWPIINGTIESRVARLFLAKDAVAQSALGDHLVGMFDPQFLLSHSVFTAPISADATDAAVAA